MTAYRVDVLQGMRDDEHSVIPAPFTEYVETLEQAARIVKRFHGVEADTDRVLTSITITTIHIQTMEEK